MLHAMTLVLATAVQVSGAQPGVDAIAPRTVKGSPATFDLAGFRLGMTEADAEQVVRRRGMTVRRRTRARTFEDRVREVVTLRGGKLPPRGGSVLDDADLEDGTGGRIIIRLLAWPDGARIRSVTYLPPAGTPADAWRSRLVERFGPPSRDSGSIDEDGLHARWCGQALCLGEGSVFRLTADVGPRGGQIVLSQPEGTSRKVTVLVEEAAASRIPDRRPAF